MWSEKTYKNEKENGLLTQWWDNGNKRQEVPYKDGLVDGLWTEWYENGHKKSEINYIKGSREGLITEYRDNREKKSEITYNNGIKLENWSYWDKTDGKEYNGRISRRNDEDGFYPYHIGLTFDEKKAF